MSYADTNYAIFKHLYAKTFNTTYDMNLNPSLSDICNQTLNMNHMTQTTPYTPPSLSGSETSFQSYSPQYNQSDLADPSLDDINVSDFDDQLSDDQKLTTMAAELNYASTAYSDRTTNLLDRPVAGARWTNTLKTFFMPAVAGYEDYLGAGLALAAPPLDGHDHAPFPPYAGEFGPVAMQELFIKGDAGTGSIIQLTVTTVYEVLARPPRRWELQFLERNRGHPQWSVAAVLLGLNSLPTQLMNVIVHCYSMHMVPLVMWRKVFADWMVALRRCPILAADPTILPADVLILRKVFNCTYRSNEEADFPAEKHRRTKNTPAHLGLDSHGRLSREAWHHETQHHMKQLANEIINATLTGARIDTLQEWWDARWAWTPSGSSSNRFAANDMKSADARLQSAVRPNKKSVFEQMPDDYAKNLVYHYPSYYMARKSTKPEPGGKARALYAVCDENFIITSYASVHIEKYMNIWGIKAKQTPSDVVAWIAADRRKRRGEVWLSLDYSDYNTDHEDSTLAAMNWHLAHSWSVLGAGQPATQEKVLAAVWAAKAHRNKWVKEDEESAWRVWASLFSGDRDTARDNTLLHGVYSRSALNYTKLYDSKVKLLDPNYTGDDEDTLLPDWVSAMHYLNTHSLMGFVLKPAKQMVSSVIHEFLQRMAVPDSTPTRPLFAVLAQLASGNWYKDVYIWYDSAIQSVSDNVWELVSRGMPLAYGRRLAVKILNATMRVPERDYAPDGSTVWRQLEWWTYRNSGPKQHPLWANTGVATTPCPSIEAKPTPSSVARGNATNAWIDLKQRELRIPDGPKWQQYREHCLKESYAGMYVKSRADVHRHFALNEWPIRSTKPEQLDAPGVPEFPNSYVNKMLLTMSVDRRPAKEDEVLSRMGLDTPLVNALGGLMQVLPYMKPDVMKFYSRPELSGYIPLQLFWLDPAIRAWYGASGMSRIDRAENYVQRLEKHWPSRHLETTSADGRPLRYVYLAPNAAGKSTFIASNPWCADTDAIVSTMQLHSDLHFNSKLPQMGRSARVAAAISDVLFRQNYAALTTQMDITEWIQPSEARDYELRIVVVRPEDEILSSRLRLRGWSDLKIQRRIARWDGIISRVLSNTTHFSESEKSSFQFVTEFP